MLTSKESKAVEVKARIEGILPEAVQYGEENYLIATAIRTLRLLSTAL